jgi:hypothetical protein
MMSKVRLSAVCTALCLVSHALPARADAKECISANDRGGSLRSEGKLLAAKREYLACAAAACPKAIRQECDALVAKVDASIPSVVFSATDASGNDTTEVRVWIDGEKVADTLDGRAVPLDPGEHRIRFEAGDGSGSFERTIVAREGDKHRAVRLELGAAVSQAAAEPTSPPSPPPSAPDEAPREPATAGPPVLAYVFAGLGVVALGSFTYFALTGKDQEDDLMSRCAPNCERDEADSLHQKYLIADVSLGVAVVSLGVATVLFLSSGSSSSTPRASLRSPRVELAVFPSLSRFSGVASIRF